MKNLQDYVDEFNAAADAAHIAALKAHAAAEEALLKAEALYAVVGGNSGPLYTGRNAVVAAETLVEKTGVVGGMLKGTTPLSRGVTL